MMYLLTCRPAEIWADHAFLLRAFSFTPMPHATVPTAKQGKTRAPQQKAAVSLSCALCVHPRRARASPAGRRKLAVLLAAIWSEPKICCSEPPCLSTWLPCMLGHDRYSVPLGIDSTPPCLQPVKVMHLRITTFFRMPFQGIAWPAELQLICREMIESDGNNADFSFTAPIHLQFSQRFLPIISTL